MPQPEPAPSRDPGSLGELSLPRALGRYRVIEKLGQGGMGVVYAAHDPSLDRRVALKLLRPTAGAGSQAPSRRLVREARALARLSHPNVVQVYEAGILERGVYVAMELVEGQSLREYCQSEPRPHWRAILDKYLSAARGLGAAHDAGMIHRDFKPDNVLLGDDGRVRVADFGLATALAAGPEPESPTADEARADAAAGSLEDAESLNAQLTMPGSFLGTPAFMAPEQHDGEGVGAHSDQYSFCAALYQGLYDRLPFDPAVPSVTGLLLLKLKERFTEVPADSDVPDWVRAVVVRGLAARPEHRWPSMAALVAALDDDPAVRRRRLVRTAGLAALVVGLGALAVLGWTRQPAVEAPCTDVGHAIADVWNPQVRERMRQAFVDSRRAHAHHTFDKVARYLDDYTNSWSAMRLDTCEASQVRGEQPARVHYRRVQCLQRRLGRAQALVDVLAENPGAEVVDRSLDAVSALPTLDHCADVDALMARVPPPEDPVLRAKSDQLGSRLDRVRALLDAGRYRDAEEPAAAALADAEKLALPVVTARALYLVGEVQNELGKDAMTALERALLLAGKARDDQLVAKIWSTMLHNTGAVQGRHQHALVLAPGALAAGERAGDGVRRAWILRGVAQAHMLMGQYRLAAARAQEALAAYPPDTQRHPGRATTLNLLGVINRRMGSYEEARNYLERALSLAEATQGPEHPSTASVLNNLGTAYVTLGRLRDAVVAFERATTIQEDILGPWNRDVAVMRGNIGATLFFMKDYRTALGHFEQALAIRKRALGEDHPEVADSLLNLGENLSAMKRFEDAVAYQKQAVAINERAHGDQHLEVARALTALGDTYLAMDRPRDAVGHLERAVSIPLSEESRLERSASRFALARALVAASGDRTRALQLAREAAAGYRQTDDASELARVSAWLEEQER